MKKLYLLKCVIFVTSVFCLTVNSNANWKKSEEKHRTLSTPYTQHTQYTKYTHEDSLSRGMANDRVNDLRDENGNRISNGKTELSHSEDPEGDALQRKISANFDVYQFYPK